MGIEDEIAKMEAHFRSCACKSSTPYFSARQDKTENDHASEQMDTMVRTFYQHDRDKILYSHSFRRLRLKTQIFPEHVADHLRTRLDHTLEVAQIARHLARQLGLNEDLVDAISLGHDIGHTPFAHSGERALNKYLKKFELNGFKHNWQGLRIVDILEKAYPNQKGINLTNAVRIGILKHTQRRYRDDPDYICDCDMGTILEKGFDPELKKYEIFEIQIVQIADDIAGVIHDIEDSLIANTYTLNDIFHNHLNSELIKQVVQNLKRKGITYSSSNPKNNIDISILLSRLRSELIYLLTLDIVETSRKEINTWESSVIEKSEINFNKFISDGNEFPIIIKLNVHKESFSQLKQNLSNNVISSERVNRMDEKADRMIENLLDAYKHSPRLLPDTVLESFKKNAGIKKSENIRKWDENELKRLEKNNIFIRSIVDYVSGMTDRYALREYDLLFSAYPRASL